MEKIGADLKSSLNILGHEVDQLRLRVEMAEMEDMETTREEEKPESPTGQVVLLPGQQPHQ